MSSQADHRFFHTIQPLNEVDEYGAACPQSSSAGRRLGHQVPACHQGDAEGNADGRRPAAHPIRHRGMPGRGHRRIRLRDRPQQGRDRGSLRLTPTNSRRRCSSAARHRSSSRHKRRRPQARQCDVHSPAAAARPGPRRMVCPARGSASEPFAVLLPDELTISSPTCTAQLVAAHEKTGGSVAAVMEVPRAQTKSYGIAAVKAEKDGLAEMTGIVEKPKPEEAPSTLAWIGRCVLEAEVFEHLDRHETGAGGEIQLTDAMAKMIGTRPFHAMRYTGRRYDCGNRLGFLEANVAIALASRRHRGGYTRVARPPPERLTSMRIAMIGSGYVGLVSGACFAQFGHDVACVDKEADKIARAAPGRDSDLRARARSNGRRQRARRPPCLRHRPQSGGGQCRRRVHRRGHADPARRRPCRSELRLCRRRRNRPGDPRLYGRSHQVDRAGRHGPRSGAHRPRGATGRRVRRLLQSRNSCAKARRSRIS